jgi:lipopolysaccharide/colanic/teichoic acid biosynthesis glycosyltransferase
MWTLREDGAIPTAGCFAQPALGNGRRFPVFKEEVSVLVIIPSGKLSLANRASVSRDFFMSIRMQFEVGAPFVSLGSTNTVCQSNAWVNSRTRRCLECVLAAIVLLMLLPVMAVCAVMVGLSSPGPILFRQRRMGRNGKEFTFYKFRSMIAEISPEAPSHTVHGDRRITAVGAFLRLYKFDELPQFWNVLKGDMSFVGPRPKLPHHEALQMPFRPGITGEATLAFRNEEQMLLQVPRDEVDAFYEIFFKPVKAELDLAYMRKATPQSDLLLLWQTVVACCFPSVDPASELFEILSRYMPTDPVTDAIQFSRRTARQGSLSRVARVNSDPAPVVED